MKKTSVVLAMFFMVLGISAQEAEIKDWLTSANQVDISDRDGKHVMSMLFYGDVDTLSVTNSFKKGDCVMLKVVITEAPSLKNDPYGSMELKMEGDDIILLVFMPINFLIEDYNSQYVLEIELLIEEVSTQVSSYEDIADNIVELIPSIVSQYLSLSEYMKADKNVETIEVVVPGLNDLYIKLSESLHYDNGFVIKKNKKKGKHKIPFSLVLLIGSVLVIAIGSILFIHHRSKNPSRATFKSRFTNAINNSSMNSGKKKHVTDALETSNDSLTYNVILALLGENIAKNHRTREFCQNNFFCILNNSRKNGFLDDLSKKLKNIIKNDDFHVLTDIDNIMSYKKIEEKKMCYKKERKISKEVKKKQYNEEVKEIKTKIIKKIKENDIKRINIEDVLKITSLKILNEIWDSIK